jgi:hypothetical protein
MEERKLTPKEKRYLKKEEAYWDNIIEKLRTGEWIFGGWPCKNGPKYAPPETAVRGFSTIKKAVLRIKKEEILSGKLKIE